MDWRPLTKTHVEQEPFGLGFELENDWQLTHSNYKNFKAFSCAKDKPNGEDLITNAFWWLF